MNARQTFKMGYGTVRDMFRTDARFGRDSTGRIDGGALVRHTMGRLEHLMPQEMALMVAWTMVYRHCVWTDIEYMQARLTQARLNIATHH